MPRCNDEQPNNWQTWERLCGPVHPPKVLEGILPDDFFNGTVRDVNAPVSLPGREPAQPMRPSFPHPPVYGVRLACKGDLSAGRLVAMAWGGQWRTALFRSRVGAARWLNRRYARQWPEFIEVERLTHTLLDSLETVIYPEEIP